MATTTKMTKAMLCEELEETRKTVSELEDKLVNYERYEAYESVAGETYGMFENFMNAGFTREEALTLAQQLVLSVYSDKTRPIRYGRNSYRY